MDLRFIADAEPTPSERAALDDVLGSPGSSWEGGARLTGADGNTAAGGHAARAQRHLLLPALWALQERIGWISPGGLNDLCRRLTVPPADAYGVASFYALFALEPRPPRVVHVCEDVACRCHGAQELIAQLEERFGREGELSDDGSATWHRSPCLGQCDRAPAALVSVAGDEPLERAQAPVTATVVLDLLAGGEPGPSPTAPLPQAGDASLRLLRRVGVADAASIDDYRAHGGYAALRRAFELGPEGVLREVKDSKLVGRGGAAFPTGVKWEAVARQPARPHYLVCNADESEPGTFKDRELMEGDPFAVIEAMTIAAYATGCERGYLYLRGEYPEALHALEHALAQARARGFLGANVMGEGLAFDVEIRRGAGAYICGEETAIFESIEGKRGEPRNKPPFPVEVGLFGKPTVVNNVETLVNVLDVVLGSGPAFAEVGTEGSTGSKLLCVSGHVARPGTYEVRFGATLREVLDLAGGVPGGRPLQAVLMGGAAGGFLGPDDLDVPLTFEGARAAGTTLGSGVVLVLDDTVDLPRLLQRIAAFFRDESCGQCVPCRVGTVRQEEALARLVAGEPLGGLETELALIAEVGQCMRDASICGLGQTASSAVESAIQRLARLFRGAVVTELLAPSRMVELEVDGQPVRVFEGATILDACRKLEIDTPTLCFDEPLRPANVCRVCVVELEGSRVLVPSCSRTAEAGMKVRTDSDRVRVSRKLVMELLASSVDLSTTPAAPGYLERYDAAPGRFGPSAAAERRAGPCAYRASHDPGRSHGRNGAPAGQGGQRAVRARLREVHPLLPLRRRLRRPASEHLRDPRGRPRLRCADLDRARHAAARIGVRLLRQLHRRLPDGRAHVPLRARAPRGGRVAGGRADGHGDDVPVLRRRLLARAPRPGQPDRQGDEPGRPRRHARQPLHQGPLRLLARAGLTSPLPTRVEVPSSRTSVSLPSGAMVPATPRWPPTSTRCPRNTLRASSSSSIAASPERHQAS